MTEPTGTNAGESETPREGESYHAPPAGWLDDALRGWAEDALHNDAVPELGWKLLMTVGINPYSPMDEVVRGLNGARLLEFIDELLKLLHPSTIGADPPGFRGYIEVVRQNIASLNEVLEYGRSAYRVSPDGRRLERRLNPTVAKAARQAINSASNDAGRHLDAAWANIYGTRPDPDAAYREAVLAVEAVSCPLVLPKAAKATLGTVLAHLRQSPQKWQLTLVDKHGQPSIAPLVELLARLWEGQVSRHAGGTNCRSQTHAEAVAALHVAVLAVQWLSSGVLSPVP